MNIQAEYRLSRKFGAVTGMFVLTVAASFGEVVADVYLGTSPGYQQVHARRADDEAVYSVGIANYQVPPEADDWLDKTLLQPRGDIASVSRKGGWSLHRGEEGWLLSAAEADDSPEGDQAESLEQGRAADQDKALELVRKLAPESPSAPDAVLAVTDDEGTYRLSLFGNEANSQYRVQSDRRDGWFTVAGYTADQIVVEKSSLLPSEDETASERGGEPSAEEGAESVPDAAPAPAPPPHEPGE